MRVTQSNSKIDTAMVLAAGLGKRMRPLTDHQPKPMVPLAGRPLIDHTLDRLAKAGIQRAVVNVHYKAEVLEDHLKARSNAGLGPSITISDERGLLLETGGGLVKAMPLLGTKSFLVCNSDTTWIEDPPADNLAALLTAWDPARMDCLLLLAEKKRSLGYAGDGDFHISADGLLTRRQAGETTPHVFAGVSITKPQIFKDAPQGPFSLNLLWDTAINARRLFGVIMDGWWMHVGTPEALSEADYFIAQRSQRQGRMP